MCHCAAWGAAGRACWVGLQADRQAGRQGNSLAVPFRSHALTDPLPPRVPPIHLPQVPVPQQQVAFPSGGRPARCARHGEVVAAGRAHVPQVRDSWQWGQPAGRCRLLAQNGCLQCMRCKACRLLGGVHCLNVLPPGQCFVSLTHIAGLSAPPSPTPPRRVLSLRCALSHFLLQLASDPRSPVLFRCTSSAGSSGLGVDVAGLMPTLFLLKDALLQVGARVGGGGRGWELLQAGRWCASSSWPICGLCVPPPLTCSLTSTPPPLAASSMAGGPGRHA